MKVVPFELSQQYAEESRTRTISFLGAVASFTVIEGLAARALVTEHPVATLVLAVGGFIATRIVGEPGLNALENMRHTRRIMEELPEQHLPASGQ